MKNTPEFRTRNMDLSTAPRLAKDGQASMVADRRMTAAQSLMAAAASDESMVIDDRASLRPAEAVENRLSRLLEDAVMPISHLQTRGMLRAR